MGWGTREFVRLPLCEEGGTALGRIVLGHLSRLTLQSASDLHRVALRDAVCADAGGNSQYLQEIPLILWFLHSRRRHRHIVWALTFELYLGQETADEDDCRNYMGAFGNLS